jgi:hypothetical protein
MQLISSFLSERKSTVSAGGEICTPTEIQAGVPQDSVLSPTSYSIYVNDTIKTPAACLILFAHDTCMHATDRKKSLVFRKLQRGLNSSEKWYERWNIKMNEDKKWAV